MILTALLAAVVTVAPKATDEALINPGMGLVHYGYSSRIWAYDTGLGPGDTIDFIPGTSVVYMRLPWSYLEPEEGDYRWDLLDLKARPWIEKGKKIAFRVAIMDHTMLSIPQWAIDAGIKGEWKPYKSGDHLPWFEPVWDDPVLLEKHGNFLRAFAERYDGNPDVAFVDVGSFGSYGEGHIPGYWRGHIGHTGESLERVVKEYTEGTGNPLPTEAEEIEFQRLARLHIDLIRKALPNTYLVISDDFGGSRNPAADHPLMAYARKLGIGFRDDSIFCVEPPACWAHANWARSYAKWSPVVVETGHMVRLDTEGGGDSKIQRWLPERILENLEAYQASYYTVQGFPKHVWRRHSEIMKELARRIGYRFELRRVSFPAEISVGGKVVIESEWVNTGVAPKYTPASLTWNLLDAKGTVVWSSVDRAFDFRSLEPKLKGVEKPVAVKSVCRFGFTTKVPVNNDGVLAWARKHPEFDPGERVELLKAGAYTLAVSVGRRDGRPEIALPLAGDQARRMYPIGTVKVLRQ